MNTPAFDELQVRTLLDACERAQAEGRVDEAGHLLARARMLAPDFPLVLGAAGVFALRRGDALEAKALLERSIAGDTSNPRVYLNLASSLRALGETDGEMRALQSALTLDPYFFLALIQKASLYERLGNKKESARTYQNALNSLQEGMQLPAAWQPFIEHAQRVVFANLQDLENWLRDRMREVREQHQSAPQDRVDDCLAAILGRKRIYVQQPNFLHFPRLPALSFYDRAQFPWLAGIEAATDTIRSELSALLMQARDEFTPYLTHDPSDPLNQWKDLNQSRRWSALFLFKDGERIEKNIARCPQTTALLNTAPLARIPHYGPTAFFSLLEPGTRIPPHTGSTNTRLTVHIPLIIPPNCGFRVGAEVREWQPGTALVFDDTIQHAAWNDSDEPRVIMIFDIWNPLLTQAERDLITVATASINEFYAS